MTAPRLTLPTVTQWPTLERDLDTLGHALLRGVLPSSACEELAALYDNDPLFRSRITMQRHGFGKGEYKYFAYPLPDPIQALRTALYPPLARIANTWAARLDTGVVFPPDHATFLRTCHESGQSRPTPLLLRYGAGDYNCLHQDVYGERVFPLQAAVLLTPPDEFEGGEFVLTTQRPRMQSVVDVVPLRQGDAVVFPVRERPAAGSRGWHRVVMKHGVSHVRSGRRVVLGVIFHDAA